MTNAKIKLAYDVTPTVLAAFTYGYWKNDATSAFARIDFRRAAST